MLKLHARCDLRCDYCYVYTKADQRWRTAVRVISRPTIDQAAVRIGEHARDHRLPSVDLILHGGEPLLAGPELIAHAVRSVREQVHLATRGATRVAVMMQTNGLQLTDNVLDLADELQIGIGVSLDGDQTAHDRHRRTADGRGSHHRVVAALNRLTAPGHRHLFRGLLATVDLANDPVRSYEAMLEFSPPIMDFLLPQAHWSDLPPGTIPGSSATPYADWLIAVFDRWYDSPVQETTIRLFTSIMRALAGGRSSVESIGGRPAEALVIETDGTLTPSDTIAPTGALVSRAGVGGPSPTVLDTRLDDVFNWWTLAGNSAGMKDFHPTRLPTPCRPCAVRGICGGGLVGHRYRAGVGFDQTSVYCQDLLALITHVRARLEDDLRRLRNTG